MLKICIPKDGIAPDIIINPNNNTNRMTIAQLLEYLLGKVCCETGNFGDGSAFNETPIDLIKNTLLKLGHNNNGDEILYNRITESNKNINIYGPNILSKIKTASCDKIHSESSGPIVTLTDNQQKSVLVALALEKWKDCMIAHGSI